jgi:uncharacterized protein with NRDE domain
VATQDVAKRPKEELPVVGSNQKFSAILGETITKLSPRYGTRAVIVKWF